MCTATLTALIIFVLLRLRKRMLFLLTPFLFPLSNRVREGEQ